MSIITELRGLVAARIKDLGTEEVLSLIESLAAPLRHTSHRAMSFASMQTSDPPPTRLSGWRPTTPCTS